MVGFEVAAATLRMYQRETTGALGGVAGDKSVPQTAATGAGAMAHVAVDHAAAPDGMTTPLRKGRSASGCRQSQVARGGKRAGTGSISAASDDSHRNMGAVGRGVNGLALGPGRHGIARDAWQPAATRGAESAAEAKVSFTILILRTKRRQGEVHRASGRTGDPPIRGAQ